MELLLWLIVIGLFILSFVGIFVPVLPAVAFLWLAFIVYHFLINPNELSMIFWVMMSILTVIMIGSDILMNHYFVNRFGGSKYSQWGAVVAVIVGAFIYPPFGIIIVPFVVVILIEMAIGNDFKKALKTSFGSLVGFLSGVVAKIILQTLMILWFILAIVF